MIFVLLTKLFLYTTQLMLLYFYYYLKVLIATILRKVRKLEPINTKIYVNIGDLKRPFCFKGVREVRKKSSISIFSVTY